MSGQKVKLLRHRIPEWNHDHYAPISSALPFYQPEGCGYVHRVRSGVMIFRGPVGDGSFSHAAYNLWCGATALIGKSLRGNRRSAELVAEPSPARVICATCEARAIGAGQVGSPFIAGRPVRFSPRA